MCRSCTSPFTCCLETDEVDIKASVRVVRDITNRPKKKVRVILGTLNARKDFTLDRKPEAESRKPLLCVPSTLAESTPPPSDPRPSRASRSTNPFPAATGWLPPRSAAHPKDVRATGIAFAILRRTPASCPTESLPLHSSAAAARPQSPARHILESQAATVQNPAAWSCAVGYQCRGRCSPTCPTPRPRFSATPRRVQEPGLREAPAHSRFGKWHPRCRLELS